MADRSTSSHWEKTRFHQRRKKRQNNIPQKKKEWYIFLLFLFRRVTHPLISIIGHVNLCNIRIHPVLWSINSSVAVSTHTRARPVGNKGFFLIGSFGSYVAPRTAKSNPGIYHINYINTSGGTFPPIWRRRGGDIVEIYWYHWYTVTALSLNELYYEF